MAREGWTEQSLREVLDISRKNVKPENFDGEMVSLYSIPGFDEGEFPVQVEPSSVKSGKLRVIEGSILVSLLNPRIPRTGYASTTGYCSTEFAVIHPADEVDHSYLFYLLSGSDFYDYLASAARGTTGSRTRATRENILDYVCLLPPLDEQREIVRLLQGLDVLIEAGEREISSAEQTRIDLRQILLREAEEQWGVTSIADFTTFASGGAFPHKFQGRDSGEYPFFKVSDMNDPANYSSMGVSANWIDEDVRTELKAKIHPEGTVIFPKVGAALKTEK